MAVDVNTTPGITPTEGSAGIQTQIPGQSSTVSGMAEASGGIAAGNLAESDIDEQLFRYQGEDTALMQLMLKAKKVSVNSPVVDHYMIDEQRATLTTSAASTLTYNTNSILYLDGDDQDIPREYHTLLVPAVAGYKSGTTTTDANSCLQLYVVGRDATTNNPIVRMVNGPSSGSVTVAAGVSVKLLSNALYETQKEVDPDLIIPQPESVYLQKRGMNQIVSDYFEAQKKHIHFTQAMIAEQAILNFKRAGNRTLWAGNKGKMTINVPKLGQQDVYFTKGIRWQFKRSVDQSDKWTIEKLIALAKLYFTGEDVPKTALLLAGKNLLESIQCIDFSKHPEIQIISATNPIGWSVTRVHTVFGDIDIKREPTLDTLGWSNSGALIGEDRLVHYTYSTEHEFSDRVEGEEATRKGIVVWDALCLKGACHIWINGEGTSSDTDETVVLWDNYNASGVYVAPEYADVTDGVVYYFTEDCDIYDYTNASTQSTKHSVQNGTMWKATFDGDKLTWSEYRGLVDAD